MTRETQTIRVILRFALRMVVVVAFAAFSSVRFDQVLLLLLLMSSVLSAALAISRREQAFTGLNHWDEAIACAALCCLIVVFDHHALG